MNNILRTLCVAAALALAACGGKTEGGNADEPEPTPDAGATIVPTCFDGLDQPVECEQWIKDAFANGWDPNTDGPYTPPARATRSLSSDGVASVQQELIAETRLCSRRDASARYTAFTAPTCCYGVRNCSVSSGGGAVTPFSCSGGLGDSVCIRGGTMARAQLGRATGVLGDKWAADCACAILNTPMNRDAGSINECNLTWSRKSPSFTPNVEEYAIFGPAFFANPTASICIRPNRGHRVFFNTHANFYGGQGTCGGVRYVEHPKSQCDAAGVPL